MALSTPLTQVVSPFPASGTQLKCVSSSNGPEELCATCINAVLARQASSRPQSRRMIRVSRLSRVAAIMQVGMQDSSVSTSPEVSVRHQPHAILLGCVRPSPPSLCVGIPPSLIQELRFPTRSRSFRGSTCYSPLSCRKMSATRLVQCHSTDCGLC